MCGRYYTDDTTAREVEKAVGRLDGKLDMTCGDVLPFQGAAVLRNQRGRLTADVMTWGFPGIDKGKLLINARAETAAEKPLFRDSVASRRCVIPSTGFWEWDAAKQKFFFTLPGETALYMAGLWTQRDGFPCYTILTTAANASMRQVHDRMPVVLTHSTLRPWLEDPSAAADILHAVPPELNAAPSDLSNAQLRLW